MDHFLNILRGHLSKEFNILKYTFLWKEYEDDLRELFQSENEKNYQEFMGKNTRVKFLKRMVEFMRPVWNSFGTPFLEEVWTPLLFWRNTAVLAHTSPIFKELHLLKLPDIQILQICQFMFSYENKKLPYKFQEMFTLNSQIHKVLRY